MPDYDIEGAFRAIENELLDSMIRNLRHHRAEETKEGFEWTSWQTEQLNALNKYKSNNSKIFKKRFAEINSKIEEGIRESKKLGSMDEEIVILDAIKKGFKATKQSNAMQAQFFKVNERKLDALIKATKNDMRKAETAMLRMANDQYRKVIFNAQVYANTGAGTYEQAVDMATKDFLSRGINCVEYKNGARVNIASYEAMAIRTANTRAYLQGEGEKRKEWGISTVIVNRRGRACLKCLKWIGKVLIDDVWSGGKASDGPYPLMSTALAQGLYHPNCKDGHTTYFEGITEVKPLTADEIEKVKASYEKEQKINYAKRQADRFKRLSDGTLDPDDKAKYKAKAKEWRVRSREFEKGTIGGLQRIGTNDVDWDTVTSDEYRDKFKHITDNDEANEVLYEKAIEMLKNNDGSDTETLFIYDPDNNNIVFEKTGERDTLEVSLSDEEIKFIKAYPGKKIAMHNHPTNLMPTGGDFGSSGYRGYSNALVITHNGDIIEYTHGNKVFSSYLMDKRVEKKQKAYYTPIKEAQMKVLDEFVEEYGISWKIIN